MNPPPADPVAQNGFPCLDTLQAAHAKLLEATPAEELTDEDVGRVRGFLKRAAATGQRLGNATERKLAQGLLDYWSATLYTGARQLKECADKRLPASETVLAEFDVATARATAAAATGWYAEQAPEKQQLAKRLLTRLVRMPVEGRQAQLQPVPRADLADLRPVYEVETMLVELESLGAVRVTKKEPAGPELVALGSEPLTREWPPLAEWIKQRGAFRGTVRYWDEHKGSADKEEALIRGELLREAEEYHDLNATERAFLAASRGRDAMKAKSDRFWKRVFAALAAAAILFATGALGSGIWAAHEAERATAEAKRRVETEQHESYRRQKLEQEQKDAIQAKEGFESNSTLALAQLLMTEDWRAAHVARKILMIQTLGQFVFADTPEAAKVVRQNWEKLETTLRKPPENNWFVEFLNGHKDQIAKITDPATPVREAQSQLLKFSGAVRDGMALKDPEPGNPWSPYVLTMRPVWFRQVQQATARVAQAAEEERPLENARVLVNLFRRLYHGEMVLVERGAVESAMVGVEGAIREWEAAGTGSAAPADVRTRLRDAAKQLRAACAEEERSSQETKN